MVNFQEILGYTPTVTQPLLWMGCEQVWHGLGAWHELLEPGMGCGCGLGVGLELELARSVIGERLVRKKPLG